MDPDQYLSERARAELWQDQTARRVAFQAALWQSLTPDPGPAMRTRANWQAVEDWLLERQLPYVDPGDDYELDPLLMSDITNVGRRFE